MTALMSHRRSRPSHHRHINISSVYYRDFCTKRYITSGNYTAHPLAQPQLLYRTCTSTRTVGPMRRLAYSTSTRTRTVRAAAAAADYGTVLVLVQYSYGHGMLKQQIAITHKNFQLYHSGFEMNSKAFGKIRNVLNQKPLSRSQRASATRMSASRPVAVKSVESLGFPFQTSDPFLFCVYHKV